MMTESEKFFGNRKGESEIGAKCIIASGDGRPWPSVMVVYVLGSVGQFPQTITPGQFPSHFE